MSQQTLQMGASPDPATAQAQQAAEAAALAAGANVAITSTVVKDGVKVTDFQQTPGQQPAQPAQQPQGETLILGKFKTQADLEAAYKALESKLGQGQQPAQQPAQQPPQGQTPAQTSAIERARAEYAEKGAVSDETVAALEASGISRALFDQHMEGVKAQEAQIAATAYGYVGGEQQYGQMIEWAASNLSPAEIAAFDAAVVNPQQSEFAIKSLFARFQQSGTFEPQSRVQGSSGAQAGDMFRSRHELMAAMRDERYTKNDVAFHAEVQRKIANSMRAGIDVFA
jgi:hypothetical protein